MDLFIIMIVVIVYRNIHKSKGHCWGGSEFGVTPMAGGRKKDNDSADL